MLKPSRPGWRAPRSSRQACCLAEVHRDSGAVDPWLEAGSRDPKPRTLHGQTTGSLAFKWKPDARDGLQSPDVCRLNDVTEFKATKKRATAMLDACSACDWDHVRCTVDSTTPLFVSPCLSVRPSVCVSVCLSLSLSLSLSLACVRPLSQPASSSSAAIAEGGLWPLDAIQWRTCGRQRYACCLSLVVSWCLWL